MKIRSALVLVVFLAISFGVAALVACLAPLRSVMRLSGRSARALDRERLSGPVQARCPPPVLALPARTAS